MEPSAIDNELNKYWPKLTKAQKKSVLDLVKSFINADEETSIDRYNEEIDNAVIRVESGEFYTQEEVEQMSRNW